MNINYSNTCDYCDMSFSNFEEKIAHQNKCTGTKNCTPQNTNETNEEIITLLARIAEMAERTALAVEVIERKAKDIVSLLKDKAEV